MSRKLLNPIDKRVGARIRMGRIMTSVSQDQLAGHLGISFQQIQKYETGRSRVGAGRLQQIAQVLNQPIGFFFEGLANVESAGVVSTEYILAFLADSDGLALAKAFQRVSSRKVRHRLVSLVEAIVGARSKAPLAAGAEPS